MMKKIAISFILLIAGAIGGFLLTINLFAVDIDLLAIPYSNTPVVLMEDITIEQGGISVVLPKGSKITYRFAPKGMPVYAVDIVGDYGVRPDTQPINQGSYFYVQSAE